jgi:hypothetical protein
VIPAAEFTVKPGLHLRELITGGLHGHVLQLGVERGVDAQSVLLQVFFLFPLWSRSLLRAVLSFQSF